MDMFTCRWSREIEPLEKDIFQSKDEQKWKNTQSIFKKPSVMFTFSKAGMGRQNKDKPKQNHSKWSHAVTEEVKLEFISETLVFYSFLPNRNISAM